MIDQIKKIPEVKAVTPTVRTYGLAEIDAATSALPSKSSAWTSSKSAR